MSQLPTQGREVNRTFAPGGQTTFAWNVLLLPVSAAFLVVVKDNYTLQACSLYLWLKSPAEITIILYYSMDSALAP